MVSDSVTRMAIPGASLYINGTSTGTSAFSNGAFSLGGFPEPPYQLTVSSVGYVTQKMEITENTAGSILINLVPDTILLKEVTVNGGRKYCWDKFGQEFFKDFIGCSAFAEKCKILNKRDIQFYYDEKNQNLRAFSKKPVLIRNEALGYLVTYWITEYFKDYKNNYIYFEGTSYFEDLITRKTLAKKKTGWEKNRKSAFRGSVQHFIQSLCRDSIAEEGFQVRKLIRMKTDELFDSIHPKDTLNVWGLSLDSLKKALDTGELSNKNEISGLQFPGVAEDIYSWLNHSEAEKTRRFLLKTKNGDTRIYKFTKIGTEGDRFTIKSFSTRNLNFSTGGVISMLDTTIVKTSEIVQQDEWMNKMLSFRNYLQIEYTKEAIEDEFFTNFQPFGNRRVLYQTSVISLIDADEILLDKNGNFSPPSKLLLEGYWSYEKIDKLLPLGFDLK